MSSLLLKVFGFLIDFLFPGKVKELRIGISRLDIANPKEVQDFMEVFEETFPPDGRNYTAGELLNLLVDVDNSKKHVRADNIILVAKYKDSIIGFIACFYYPEKQFGIIGYFGKTKAFKEEGKYIGTKLLRALKNILTHEHHCKLLVFELESGTRNEAKAFLFKLYARQLGFTAYEIRCDYYRPKISLEEGAEELLSLLFIPLGRPTIQFLTKAEVIDLLGFIHFDCYGDYYNADSEDHHRFRDYMHSRMELYETTIPERVEVV